MPQIRPHPSLFATAVLLVAATAAAQEPALTLTRTAGFAFGRLVGSSTAGAITVTPTGGWSTSGGVTLLGGAGPAPASFTASGAPNQSYLILLPSSVTLTSGSNTITLDAFTSNPSGSGALDANGTQTVLLGATLNLGGQQSAGSYSGSFELTVAYE